MFYTDSNEARQISNRLAREAFNFGKSERQLLSGTKGTVHSLSDYGSPVKGVGVQKDSQQFKRWFGDSKKDPAGASKIVDENGEPLVVYHATNNDEATSIWDERTKQYLTSHKPFTIFKRKVDGLRNNGHFFTSDRSNAEGYGNTTYACYLNIRNPLVIDCNGSDYSSPAARGRELKPSSTTSSWMGRCRPHAAGVN